MFFAHIFLKRIHLSPIARRTISAAPPLPDLVRGFIRFRWKIILVEDLCRRLEFAQIVEPELHCIEVAPLEMPGSPATTLGMGPDCGGLPPWQSHAQKCGQILTDHGRVDGAEALKQLKIEK